MRFRSTRSGVVEENYLAGADASNSNYKQQPTETPTPPVNHQPTTIQPTITQTTINEPEEEYNEEEYQNKVKDVIIPDKGAYQFRDEFEPEAEEDEDEDDVDTIEDQEEDTTEDTAPGGLKLKLGNMSMAQQEEERDV
jgi:hypothetical protein